MSRLMIGPVPILIVAAGAAVVNFTLTVTNASITSSQTSISVSGPATLTVSGVGTDTGTFSASGSLTNIGGGNVTVPFTVTLGHGTFNGTMTFPLDALGGSSSVSGSATITSGTGRYTILDNTTVSGSGFTGSVLSGGDLSFSISGTSNGYGFTFTVTNAPITISGTSVFSGPATLTLAGGSPDTGTFSASGSLTALSGNLSIPFTVTLGLGTITGTMTFPETALLKSGAVTGSATITGGTGSYAGYTGSTLTASGTVTGSLLSAGTLSFSISGTVTTSAATPTISALANNYSFTLPGLPNYGIAPGSIFVIFGTDLNSQAFSGLQSSAAPGLQTTLNGTSISVTVNGVTTQPFIYYTSATQVAAVLPSTTPVGTGTITVTNNGQPSAAAQIQVVQSAFGILTQNQAGTGQAVVEDPTNNYSNFSFTNSVKPGQLIALWGSGVGGDTNDNDRLYPQSQDNLTNIPMQIYIGGISATITYRGRSQFPGLDQIFVTVPAGVTPGCAVSLVISSGTTTLKSNFVSIPVAQNGGTCSDSFSPFTGTLLESLSEETTANVGVLDVGQVTAPSATGGLPSTTSTTGGIFYRYTQAQFDAAQAEIPSIGSCVIVPPTPSSATTSTGLDAGSTITLTSPTGQVLLTRNPVVAGIYAPGTALASSFVPSTGGTFTFIGAGGADVGAFTASISLAPPLVWTNAASIATVNRANGVMVTWSGGAANSYVIISGSSSTSVSFQTTPVTVTFICIAPVSAGQFTVPSAVTQSLPPASAGGLTPPMLTVENAANPVLFSASGLDLGYVTGFVSDSINVTYQ